MAVEFADPFGSFIDGAIEGQEYETSYQEHALDSYVTEMRLLDDLVLAPQRKLASEQRSYARQLDLMMQRHELARQRQQEGYLLGGGGKGLGTPAMTLPTGEGYTLNTDMVTPVLGGVISAPGSASIASPTRTRTLGVPQ